MTDGITDGMTGRGAAEPEAEASRGVLGSARGGADPPWGSVAEVLREAAGRTPDAEFLRFPGRSLTFAEVHRRSNRLARVLAGRGIGRGDRVAIMLDNGPWWPLSWFAVLKAGAIAVPVNARYRRADLEFVLCDSGAALALISAEHAGLVREAGTPALPLPDPMVEDAPVEEPRVAVEPGDIANLQYTSGTTGFPKACMLSHDYWLRMAWQTGVAAGLRADDVMLVAQPFSYMDPQWASLMSLMGGRPIVVLPRFSASGFWPAIREHRATLTYVLGAMPLLLFRQPPGPLDRENRMRLVLCSGILPAMHRRFEERWGAPWRELYGSTESGLDLIVAPEAADTVGTGAMGRPPPGKEVRIAGDGGGTLPDGEVGEVVIRGRPMMRGYWNHPDSTERAFRGGWYHSGDLGYRDAAGWIHHAGRLKDMIRRGGENISAAEVEHVLGRHPAVSAVALVPVPDELFGELPKAFIQLAPGHRADTASATSIIDHARGQLAPFKVPAYLEFVEAFPMTPSARIQKRRLRDGERGHGRGSGRGVFDAAAGTWIRS